MWFELLFCVSGLFEMIVKDTLTCKRMFVGTDVRGTLLLVCYRDDLRLIAMNCDVCFAKLTEIRQQVGDHFCSF